MFSQEGFDINDELYRQIHPYRKGCFRTLTCIDLSARKNTHNNNGKIKTVPPEVERKPGEPKPANIPLNLEREYQPHGVKKRGKVGFYATFGHNESAYWNPEVVEHYLLGLQYVLGDLDADDASDRLITDQN